MTIAIIGPLASMGRGGATFLLDPTPACLRQATALNSKAINDTQNTQPLIHFGKKRSVFFNGRPHFLSLRRQRISTCSLGKRRSCFRSHLRRARFPDLFSPSFG